MIVKNLNIKEFRGIKSCKRPIEFTNFNVLIGRNNSGKSSVLEALSLIPNPKSKEYVTNKSKIQFLAELHSPLIFSKEKEINDPYKPLLYLYSGTATIDYNNVSYITISLRTCDSEYKPPGHMPNMSKVPDYMVDPDYNIDSASIALANSSISVLFIPYDTEYIKTLEKKIDSLKFAIMKKGIHRKVAERLNECVDDEYSEIYFGDPIVMRKVLADNTPYININDLGSGAEKLIKIMALIEIMEPKLILIDDFGAGFHPSMINIFLKWLTELKSQVVLSTHSADILYQLTKLDPESCNILFLKKTHEDILKYKVLSIDKVEDFLNANTDPRLLNF